MGRCRGTGKDGWRGMRGEEAGLTSENEAEGEIKGSAPCSGTLVFPGLVFSSRSFSSLQKNDLLLGTLSKLNFR